MVENIIAIPLPLPLGMGRVNCYLLENANGFYLVDTGAPGQGRALNRALEEAGCRPGGLKLVLLTHGDFDHTGSAAALRRTFGAPLAMHAADREMAERGDMFSNRHRGNAWLGRLSAGLFGFGPARRFQPDLLLEDGQDLETYGLAARVVSIPGHSLGSIGVLTAAGNLFCGDLLENTKQPALGSIMDDPDAAQASLQRLHGLGVQRVYPGHGRPFALQELTGG